jgi:hypothetical protein
MNIQRLKGVQKIKIQDEPTSDPDEKLQWPRFTEDGVSLGIDVEAKRKDIIKIVYKYFKVPEISMNELLQEVFLAILHKNYTRSAHNPKKSSFGHYVFMVANNVCINLVHKKKRFEKEKDSIDAPVGQDDDRTLLDTIDANEDKDEFHNHLENIEEYFRNIGLWDIARYIRATRSGAPPDVIREAMSWGGRKITTKVIRDMRNQMMGYATAVN